MLTLLGGADQGCHDRAVFARAIKNLFDRQNIRVDGGFFYQSHDGFKTFVWVAQQNILPCDIFKHADAGVYFR